VNPDLTDSNPVYTEVDIMKDVDVISPKFCSSHGYFCIIPKQRPYIQAYFGVDICKC
jgi:hypothetical protein